MIGGGHNGSHVVRGQTKHMKKYTILGYVGGEGGGTPGSFKFSTNNSA